MKKIQIFFFGFITFIGLFSIIVIMPSESKAQIPGPFNNKATSDQTDDERLCRSADGPLKSDKYCLYYAKYKENEDVFPTEAAKYRDRMIDLLKVQIDDYYNGYKNGNVKKTKWFQSLLDILGVGLAFTGNIVGGLRNKTVLAATSGALQAGRDSVNSRFDLLRQQILINKMNANRIEQWTTIVEKKQDGIDKFSWDDAKGELQQYLFRGSFIDALDSLVENTGAQVQAAQTNLQKVLNAVSQTTLAAKLQNFTTYIRPMNERAIKLDADIAAITGLAAPTPAQLAQLVDLQAKKTSLMENYKNAWLAIKIGGDFDAIDKKINDQFGPFVNVIGRYSTFKANFNSTPQGAITADDFDFVLTKVNAVVGEDEDLNKRFLEILKTHKL